MTGLYLTDLADWLRAGGLDVVEYDGWRTRARSSGGFPAMPLGVQWHHTASAGPNPQADCDYMWRTSSSRPVGNVYLARDGRVWVGAAGAANTAGKGGPYRLSRGTVPVDQANTRTFAVEAANDGVGQPWPQVQIDAYFTLSNVLNARFGNQPGDLFTHADWTLAAGGYRKIDPAVAGAVEGPWQPRPTNTSNTWNVDDVRVEAARRATTAPPDNGGDDMALTDDDIARIATAVWQRAVALKTGEPGETRPAGDLLGWTHANAAQAKDQIVAHRGTVEPAGP